MNKEPLECKNTEDPNAERKIKTNKQKTTKPTVEDEVPPLPASGQELVPNTPASQEEGPPRPKKPMASFLDEARRPRAAFWNGPMKRGTFKEAA